MAGKRVAAPTGSKLSDNMQGFSSGYGLIDMISGVPGILFPRATIVELFGLKSASKTTLLLETIAYNQMIMPTFKVFYADFEKMIRNQVPYLNSLGVETSEDKFVIAEPDTQEEGCKQILDAVRSEEYDMIIVDIIGNRFLYNMVRIIIGTLLDIERNNKNPEYMAEVLEAQDRTKAGKTVSPSGLTLLEVEY